MTLKNTGSDFVPLSFQDPVSMKYERVFLTFRLNTHERDY
jgi:hypothetical protein